MKNNRFLGVLAFFKQALILGERTVVTFDMIATGTRIPIGAVPDGVPLRLCTAEGNGGQIAAITERGIVDVRHAVGDKQAHQAGTAVECVLADGRHAVGDHDARQAVAAVEQGIANARHSLGNGNA